MQKLRRLAAALVVLGAAAPAAMIATAAPAYAAKQSLGQKVGKPLQEAQKLAQEKKFAEALVKAKEAEAVPNKTPYEEMVVQDFLAYLYVSLKDYPKAAAASEAAFNTGQTKAEEKAQRLKNLALLFYQTKNYAKTLTYANRYFTEVGANSELSALVAQVYYLQGDYAKALSASLDLIRAAEKAGTKPAEQSLQLALSSAYRIKDGQATKSALFKLVELYPSKEYWSDLVGVLHSQQGMTERFSLDVMRLQNAAGVLTDPGEYSEMAQTALQLGLPGEAQRVLEKGFAAGKLGVGPDAAREKRLLAQAKKDAAADKATLASQEAAVKATAKGDDDAKVAEAYESYGDNAKALELLTAALAKPDLKDADAARVTLGRVNLNLKKKAEAKAAFSAVKTDAKYVDLARAWNIFASQQP